MQKIGNGLTETVIVRVPDGTKAMLTEIASRTGLKNESEVLRSIIAYACQELLSRVRQKEESV